MSGGIACNCTERTKPLRQRNWRVRTRRGNYSAFNGYRFESTDYSSVICGGPCGRAWRTKAAYVNELRDETAAELRRGTVR